MKKKVLVKKISKMYDEFDAMLGLIVMGIIMSEEVS